MIKDNIARLKDDISLICQRLGRNPAEVKLVCVSKTASAEMIFQALQCGITDIGENRVQDAEQKFLKLAGLLKKSAKNYDIKYHMVGHLQTNKVKSALKFFDLIQSVDSLRVAQEINKNAEKLKRSAEVLIEVNTSVEESKFGIKPEEALQLTAEIAKLKMVRINGLMTVGEESEDSEVIRKCFKKLSLLKEKIAQEIDLPNVQMKYLSMGMTSDYRIALEEGSNMLRIGRLIFANA